MSGEAEGGRPDPHWFVGRCPLVLVRDWVSDATSSWLLIVI